MIESFCVLKLEHYQRNLVPSHTFYTFALSTEVTGATKRNRSSGIDVLSPPIIVQREAFW